jgi:hypothetical protein
MGIMLYEKENFAKQNYSIVAHYFAAISNAPKTEFSF